MAYVINGDFRCRTCESNWVTTEQDKRASQPPPPATSPSNKETVQLQSSIKDTKVIHQGHRKGPFDPYLAWLGISPSQQPPNYYRLLGINIFESNVAVIENGADRQIAHIRTVSLGDDSIAAQEILSEISAAKICLLVPEKKQRYDDIIRKSLNRLSVPHLLPPPIERQATRSPVSATPRQTPSPPVAPRPIRQSTTISQNSVADRRRPKQKNQFIKFLFVIGGGVIGIAIAVSITSYIKPNRNESVTATQGDQANPQAAHLVKSADVAKPKKESDDLSAIHGVRGEKPKPKPNRLKPEDFFPSDKKTDSVGPKNQPAKKPTQVAKTSTPSLQELQQAKIDKLIETLQTDSNVNNRVNAANQLSTLGPKARKALPVLIKALSDDRSERVHSGALLAISQMGQNAKDEIPALVKYLEGQSDAELRKQTVSTMIAINPEALPLHKILTRALTGSNSGTRMMMTDNSSKVQSRIWACQVIGSMKQSGEWAVPLLKDLLKSSGRTLDHYKMGIDQFDAAAKALGQIGVRLQGVEPLLKSLKDGKGVRTTSDDLKDRAMLVADSALRKIQQQ